MKLIAKGRIFSTNCWRIVDTYPWVGACRTQEHACQITQKVGEGKNKKAAISHWKQTHDIKFVQVENSVR